MTESELEGWHEPCTTSAPVTLKLSVAEDLFGKLLSWETQTLYWPPLFGVSENGASCTGVVPFAGLNVPFAWGHGPVAPLTLPFDTSSWRHEMSSVDSTVFPLGSVTWKKYVPS